MKMAMKYKNELESGEDHIGSLFTQVYLHRVGINLRGDWKYFKTPPLFRNINLFALLLMRLETDV